MKLMRILPLFSMLVILTSCERGEMGYSFTDDSKESDVVIFYAAADTRDAVSYLIRDNIKTIQNGSLPQEGSKKVLLLFPHMEIGQPAYLQNIKRDSYGALKIDTLYTSAAGRSALDEDVMRAVLQAAYDNFPTSEFTLILSSHGTGWLPKGYYNDPSLYENIFERQDLEAPAYTFPQFGPLTKTFGLEQSGFGTTLEMEISDLADAIPMHLKCLVLDACLLGGVEVAYELKDVCDKICFSPAEVPGRGYNYKTLASELLSDYGSPEGFSKAYFDLWAEHPDYGATSTTVVCSELERLAELCKDLFEKYRTNIKALHTEDVQGYYRYNRHFFFDLEDILVKAGINASEKAALKAALNACISYKKASSSFMWGNGGFKINTFCGLSMYLPSSQLQAFYLDVFYRTLEWNKATELVK